MFRDRRALVQQLQLDDTTAFPVFFFCSKEGEGEGGIDFFRISFPHPRLWTVPCYVSQQLSEIEAIRTGGTMPAGSAGNVVAVPVYQGGAIYAYPQPPPVQLSMSQDFQPSLAQGQAAWPAHATAAPVELPAQGSYYVGDRVEDTQALLARASVATSEPTVRLAPGSLQ